MAGSPLKRKRKEAANKAALATIEHQPPPPMLCEPGEKLTPEQVARIRVQVVSMAQVGLSHVQMAYLVGVRRETLEATFAEEVKASKLIANGLMASALFQKGIDGDVRAQELWLREHAGWFRPVPQRPDLPPELERELEEARAIKAAHQEAANDPNAGQRSLRIEFVDVPQDVAAE